MNKSYPPFLLFGLKHHLRHASARIYSESISGPEKPGTLLLKEINRIGDNAMDIYTGSLTIPEILGEIMAINPAVLVKNEFQGQLIHQKEGYISLRLSDDSEWILRYGKKEEYWVHVHPAKKCTHCYRTHGNSWKTALVICFELFRNDKQDLPVDKINVLRIQWLGLSPIKSLKQSNEIIRCISLLKEALVTN